MRPDEARCDICKLSTDPDELTPIPDCTPGIIADDWGVCPDCLIAGIAEGHVDIHPGALDEPEDDTEGEEWKQLPP
jgi:hypothetical protein